MKNKFKYLTILTCIVVLIGLVGYFNIKSNNFNITLNQCKEIIEDTDTKLSSEQIKFIEGFENKYYIDSEDNAQFIEEFIPYLKTKMEERITFNDVDDVDKLIVVSRLVALNSKSEINNLRLKLIDRKNVLHPIILEQAVSTIPLITEDDKIKNVINLIKQKKYEEAEKMCYFDIGVEEGNSEIDAFYAYCHVLMDEAKGDDMKESVLHYCELISPNYSGTYHNEINNLVLQYITLDEWKDEYDINIKAEEIAKLPEPSIGMTAEEVRASRWGNPDSVNRTTTANGTSEQWVYSINGYVYLENGVVITIQE
ncbi:MAG: hypothetical protein ACI8WT_004095 [Clostridium sp.]|jgi:hypothetical protein